MTAKEYLKQAYRLDLNINSNLKELESLRELSTSVASTQFNERVKSSPRNDAPYVRLLEKIMGMEERINAKIDRLVELKEEIGNVIGAVEDPNERMVLQYRYIHGFTWARIGETMNANARTVRRWHESALQHVVIPEKIL